MRLNIRNAMIILFGGPALGGLVGYGVFSLTVDLIGRIPAFCMVAVIAAIVGMALPIFFPWYTYVEEA